jgi:hypothetical protein
MAGTGTGNLNSSIQNPSATSITATNEVASVNIGLLRELLMTNSGKIFSAYNQSDDVISNVKQKVTETIWSNGYPILSGSSMYFNNSQISSSIEYYGDIYCYDVNNTSSATPQFSFGFADRYGRGSAANNSSSLFGLSRTLTYVSESYSPTACTYAQYRNLLLPPTDEQFTLKSGVQMDSFYFINFSRNRLKERLDAGNWEISLNLPTGSGYQQIQLIDDAGNEVNTGIAGDGGRIYAIISGSITNGPSLDTNGNKITMGIAYPDLGVLLLNASGSVYVPQQPSIPCVLSTTDYGQNQYDFNQFFVSGSSYIQARNSQQISSTYYFTRIKHNDYNFSNNPSFITGSLGDFRNPTMINNPSVYITTIGLYNDANELLAVAKLSKSLLKTFERESLVRIKLDY